MSGNTTDPSLGLPKSAPGPLLHLRRQILQSGDLGASATIEILQSDQLERWRRGERIPAEAYLHLWAEIPASAASPNSEEFCDLIYAELLLRRELGENPPHSEYLVRFPQFREQLELVAELEEYVDSGLTAEAQVSTLFDKADPAQAAASTHWPRVAGYEILGELGRGGMGIVYKARQIALQRLVALKMIRTGEEADTATLARFRVEAEAVAELQHPNIVQIYEIGGLDSTPGSGPFMALELVPGGSLAGLVASAQWPGASKEGQKRAAELVATIARAVHYAHQRGILHRDLKPGNILLQRSEVRSQKSVRAQASAPLSDLCPLTSDFCPKITDFGLAKRLEEGHGANTRTGSMLGTPSYMAPEQAAGLNREIGVATDVYGLGAILYELLTGRPPFKGETPLATLEQVRRAEPEPPSRIQRRLPADLETICLKCLQKESAKRYASAAALAEDLERFLAHKPIRARRVGAIGRAARWLRRNPTLAATVAAATIVVAVVAGVGLWNVFEERDHYHQERDHAQANLYRALVGEARSQMDARDTGWWWHALDNMSEAAQLRVADRDLGELRDLAIECMGSVYPCMRIQGTWTGHTGPATAVVVSPDGRLAVSGSRDQTVRIWSMPGGEPLAVLTGHTGAVTGLAFHPDSRRLASCSTDGTVRLWELLTNAAAAGKVAPPEFRLLRVIDPKAGRMNGVAISQDGAWLAAGGQDTKLRLFSLADKRVSKAVPDGDTLPLGREQVLEGHSGPIQCLTFSPTGELASGAADRTIRFWDLATGRQTGFSPIITGSAIRSLSFCVRREGNGKDPAVGAPPGPLVNYLVGDVNLLAWTEVDGGFSTRDLLSGVQGRSPFGAHSGFVSQVCWSPKGELLSCSTDGSLKVWHYHHKGSVGEQAIGRGEFGAVLSATFSPDGDWVVAGYFDGRIRLWQLATPPQRAIARSDSNNAVFIGAEHRLVNGRLTYDFSAGMEAPAHDFAPSAISALAIQSLGHRFAFSQGGLLRVWDQQSRMEVRQWPAHDLPIGALASSPNGKELASVSADGTVKFWDWESGRLDRTLVPGVGPLHAVGWSRDGRQLAATGERGAVVWDLNGTNEPRLRFEHDLPFSALAFGEDVLAVTGAEGTVTLRDPNSGIIRHVLRGHKNGVRALAFGPDGNLLASGASNDTVRLWNAAQGRQVSVFEAPSKWQVSAGWLAFDPLGRYLAFSHSQIWDLQSKAIVSSVYGGEFDRCGLFLADGSGILLGTEYGAVRLCPLVEIDLARKAVQGVGQAKPPSGSVRVDALTTIVPGGHVSSVWGVAASPDGRWVATGSYDQTAKLWDARTMKLVRTLTGHTDLVSGVAFSPDSQFLATGSELGPSGDVRLWEVATGREVCRFLGHKRQVVSCAFHPTLPLLATNSLDGSVWLWDVAARKPLGLLHQFDQPVYSIAFRPDGRRLAAACHDYRLAVWDWEQSPRLPAPPDHFLAGHTGAVWSVSFSADGSMLASGSERGVIILWNGETFEKLTTLWGGIGQVRGIAFSRDAQLLAGAGYDGTHTTVWDLARLRRSLREMGLGDMMASQVEK